MTTSDQRDDFKAESDAVVPPAPDPRLELARKIRYEAVARIARAVGAGPAVPCQGCGRMIFWFYTKLGKKQPIDPDEGVAHWGTCPEAGRFRTGSKR